MVLFFLLFINCYPLQLHVCKIAAVVCRCALVAAVYLVTLFVHTHPLLHTLTPPHVCSVCRSEWVSAASLWNCALNFVIWCPLHGISLCVNFTFNILGMKANTARNWNWTQTNQNSLRYWSSRARGCVLCTGDTSTILSPRTNNCLTRRVSFSGELVLAPASVSLPMSLSWSEGWTALLASRSGGWAPWSGGREPLISGHKTGHTGPTPS